VKPAVSSVLFLFASLSVTDPGRPAVAAKAIDSTVGAVVESHASDAEEWLVPGEYESHQSMWMLWPTYENKAGFPSTEVVNDLIQAMSGHTHVNLAVQDADDEAAARQFLTANRVPLDHVHFVHLEHLDLWARDMGPQFIRSFAGRLRVTDWNFNYWGYEDPESRNSSSRRAQGSPKSAAGRKSRSTCRSRRSTRNRLAGPFCAWFPVSRGSDAMFTSRDSRRQASACRFESCGRQVRKVRSAGSTRTPSRALERSVPAYMPATDLPRQKSSNLASLEIPPQVARQCARASADSAGSAAAADPCRSRCRSDYARSYGCVRRWAAWDPLPGVEDSRVRCDRTR
jgi:Porphyromonas-type peptidyl-arginine deiminase